MQVAEIPPQPKLKRASKRLSKYFTRTEQLNTSDLNEERQVLSFGAPIPVSTPSTCSPTTSNYSKRISSASSASPNSMPRTLSTRKLKKRHSIISFIGPGQRNTAAGTSTSNTSRSSKCVSSVPSTSSLSSKRSTNYSSTPVSTTASSISSTYALPSSTIYDPLQNYTPCLSTGCPSHYLPSQLGPTFYSPQPPYALSRHPGLCPSHAYCELKGANEECKREWESMRQTARRKTMGQVAKEFEDWVQCYRQERCNDARVMERRLRKRVLGVQTLCDGIDEQEDEVWDWQYTPRPCTRKDCKAPMYSPFSSSNYNFYCRIRSCGLTPLQALCPACAQADIERLERTVQEKKIAFNEQEWHLESWLTKLKKDRETQGVFWEHAQERVVRERGVRYKMEEEKSEANQDLEGKGVDTLRELCVVM